jgi:glycosyltransferase involved in cell wall biosynthesis/2-polyprenyl-3-methyl-5-hydroxy-6-metoxy-1,4-benzoquinol methylase
LVEFPSAAERRGRSFAARAHRKGKILLDSHKPRVLVFIVAYNAEKTISSVVRRIPAELSDLYQVEVLIIDDASQDSTFSRSLGVKKEDNTPFPLHVLFNPVNQGYGGNQKLGFHYAIENGFDFVALVHGDGQYAPECLPTLIEPLRRGEAAAVFGSRMLTRMGALRGGMPPYKFIGNKILTWIENKLLRANLSEFHSGYRIYSIAALRAIPFDRNSNGFHFDTEIIIQLLIARQAIKELPIPTYYGDEICHVNGLKYAWDVVAAAIKARLQELSLFYDRRFDCAPPEAASPYTLKLDYASPHTLALERIRPGSRVLDLGCAGGYMGAVLKEQKQCFVSAVDVNEIPVRGLDEFRIHDLNTGVLPIPADAYDVVLLLDVIEHLTRPETFLEQLRQELARSTSTELLISTGNVACFITRAMLMLGQFNYGKRGILDVTHTRLFTFASLRRALEQSGFTVLETKGVPGPFPLAIGNNFLSRALLAVNQFLIRISRGLFSYQIFMRVKPLPLLKSLLAISQEQSSIRAAMLETAGSGNSGALSRH